MTATVVNKDEKDLTKFAFAINQLAEGRSNAVGTFTLTTGSTTTTVTAINCGADSVPLWVPTTSNAAAAVASTFIASVSAGSFTVTHASNGQTDRTFGFVCLG
jgi:hypothetical protein